MHERLVWRLDDNVEVLERRIEAHARACEGIVATFEAAEVPIARFDNARSELETFGDIAEFLEQVAMRKLALATAAVLNKRRAGIGRAAAGARGAGPAVLEAPPALAALREASASLAPQPAPGYDDGDVETLCAQFESDDGCVVRWQDEVEARGEARSLLAAVRRCNSFDADDFTRVVVGDEQVGWVDRATLDALAPQLAHGVTCEIIDGGLADDLAVRLAPRATSVAERSAATAALVEELVDDGHIPAAKVRHELMDVHQLGSGFGDFAAGTGLLRMERAAMIYFGIPSFGVHVNGWVRER